MVDYIILEQGYVPTAELTSIGLLLNSIECTVVSGKWGKPLQYRDIVVIPPHSQTSQDSVPGPPATDQPPVLLQVDVITVLKTFASEILDGREESEYVYVHVCVRLDGREEDTVVFECMYIVCVCVRVKY